jgi:phosphotransferase system enzyme I (PtsI)
MTQEPEEVLRLTAGAPGVGVGPVLRWRGDAPHRERAAPEAPEQEHARLVRAQEEARRELRETVARVAAEVGEAESRLFKTHLALLDDPLVTGPITNGIREGLPAEQAVERAVSDLAVRFQGLRDRRLRERAADLRDVGARLLRCLAGARPEDFGALHGSVVCGESLTPSEVNLLARAAAGLVLAEGGATGHSVILARAFGLPVVLGGRGVLERVSDGELLVVDGGEGVVVLHPSAATAARYRDLSAGGTPVHRAADEDGPPLTRDGRAVAVLANVSGAAEAAAARAAGADGVGLVRTEFLFLGRVTPPSEDEQLAAYREVLAAMAPRRVVFRVLDVGGDKPLPGLAQAAELNPALGLRGIRLCLKREAHFRPQLRALLRACREANLAILLPMVTDVAEVRRTRHMLADLRRELQAAGEPDTPAPPVGVMLETPAAALMVAELAEEADFFSFGTNDLAQYVLAVDRQAEAVAGLYQPLHPAVLRLMRETAAKAAARGRPTSVCGEMAADPLAVPLLVGMGIEALSVAPAAVRNVRAAIGALSGSAARSLLDEVCAMATPADVLERLRSSMSR